MTKSLSLPKLVNFDFNKHLPQSSAEKTSDLFFVLSAAYLAARGEKELTKLMLEKALFKASQALMKEKSRFLNTFFFIDKYGPHNNIFYRYLEELERAGLIELEGRSINLTAKGLRVTSDLLEGVSQDRGLRKILVVLGQKIEEYSRKPSLAVEETHSQKVIDSTDNNKIKTISELIREINPEQQFRKGSQFKYIEPSFKGAVKKVELPPKTINQLESVLAKVEPSDFEQAADIECLFNFG